MRAHLNPSEATVFDLRCAALSRARRVLLTTMVLLASTLLIACGDGPTGPRVPRGRAVGGVRANVGLDTTQTPAPSPPDTTAQPKPDDTQIWY